MDKLKEIIAYILKKYPHKEEMSNARVTKIIYLSDWHQAIKFNRQITQINWKFDNYGPYVHDVSETVKKYNDFFNIIGTHNIFGGKKIIFTLKNGNYIPHISQEEQESLDYIISATAHLTWDEFIRVVYSTYPIMTTERYSYINLIEKASQYIEALNVIHNTHQ